MATFALYRRAFSGDFRPEQSIVGTFATWKDVFQQILREHAFLNNELKDGEIVVIQNKEGAGLTVMRVVRQGLTVEPVK